MPDTPATTRLLGRLVRMRDRRSPSIRMGVIVALSVSIVSAVAQPIDPSADARASVSRSSPTAIDECTAAEQADIRAYTGLLDHRACLQRALAKAHAAGRGLVVDAGLWNLESGHVELKIAQHLRGEGFGELPVEDARKGTIIRFGYAASTDPYGFLVTGSGATIENMEFRQAHPRLAPGWTPIVGPWAIYAKAEPYADAGGHRLTVRHVLLRNVYQGINTGLARGGTFTDIMGQPLRTGIRVEANVDEPHFSDIRFGWPYWSGRPDVMAYVHENLVAFDFERIDNPKMSNIFTFNAKVGLRCSQRQSDYNPGNCSLLMAVNMGHDSVGTGILAEDSPSLKLTNVYCYAVIEDPDSSCLRNVRRVATPEYDPPRIDIVNGDFQGSGGSALIFDWKPRKPTVHSLTSVRIRSFDHARRGAPAIRSAQGVRTVQTGIIVEDRPAE